MRVEEPKGGEVRGSLTGPMAGVPQKKPEKDLEELIRQAVEEAIARALSDFEGTVHEITNNYFEELNQSAKIQFVAVPVDSVLGDKEPTKDELLAFFEARADRIQEPNSPEFGFKQPAKAAFEYFKADYPEFLERA